MAAGPEHVVQAVNTAFRFNNRSGTAVKTTDMFDFFGLGAFYDPGEVAFFDPHVIYDSLHQRWVAIEASFDCFTDATTDVGTGYIDIAISDGPDPTLGWGVLSIGYTDALPDYPGIGTSTDKVVVSANVFALVPSRRHGLRTRRRLVPRHRDGRHGLVRAARHRQHQHRLPQQHQRLRQRLLLVAAVAADAGLVADGLRRRRDEHE